MFHNRIKMVSQFFYSFFLSMLLCTPLLCTTATPNFNISAEDMEELQKQMQEGQKKYAKMTPAEQKKVDDHFEVMMLKTAQAIEDAGGEDVINNMNPDELTEFLESLGTILKEEEEKIAAEEQKTLKPTPPQPTPAPTTIKKVTPTDIKTNTGQTQLLDVIRALIQRIESFLLKTQNIPDLPAEVETWYDERKLPEWATTNKWDIIKKRIEKINQKLHKIVDLDPKTKEPRYINNAYADESLRNNLIKLNSLLLSSEPNIDVVMFKAKKNKEFADKTEKSIINVINNIGEALFKLKIEESLNAIFDKWESEDAKKRRTQEEADIKKAEELSLQKISIRPSKSAGKSSDTGAIFHASSSSDYSGGSYDYSSPYSSYDGGPSYRKNSSYGSHDGLDTPGKKSKSDSADKDKDSSTKDGGEAKKDTDKDKDKNKDKDKIKDKKETTPDKEKIKKEKEKTKKIDRIEFNIENAIEEAQKTIGNCIVTTKDKNKEIKTGALADIHTYLTSSDAQYTFNAAKSKKDSEALKQATDRLKEARKNVDELKKQVSDAKERAEYKKNLKETLNSKEKIDLGKMINTGMVKIYEKPKAGSTWDNESQKVTAEKKYVYLGMGGIDKDGKISAPELQKIVDEIPGPITSIYDLKNAYKKLEAAIEELAP